VQLAWFPPNTTSVSQQMDQGIIRNVKVCYRKLLTQSLLTNIDSTSAAPETVTKCFEKAGFSMGEVTASLENE
jgi:hypothetical protein